MFQAIRSSLHAALLTLAVSGAGSVASAQMNVGGGLQVTEEAAQMLDKRGETVPRDIELVDSRGYPLKLSQFFPGDRPVLLNLGYFGCPKMCGEVLNNTLEGLKGIDLEPGRDFRILTVSINPKEGVELASTKKAAYVQNYGRDGAEEGWTFAVGDGAQTKALADAVGFPFRWSDATGQYAHPAALVFLSPDGKVTSYLQALSFDSDAIRLALIGASDGTLGSFWDNVKLNCLTFDPSKGAFTLTAMTIMKIGGLATMTFLAVVIFIAVRREKRRQGKPRADEALSPIA